MLMAAHDLRLAHTIAGNVVFLDRGEIVEAGPARGVRRPRKAADEAVHLEPHGADNGIAAGLTGKTGWAAFDVAPRTRPTSLSLSRAGTRQRWRDAASGRCQPRGLTRSAR